MKLVVDEEHSAALRAWLADREERVSSVVSHVEVSRTTRRVVSAGGDPACEPRAADVLAKVTMLTLSDEVAHSATTVGPPTLRSLDAIHLASALIAEPLEAFVTYDDRLAQAARAAGLSVVQPGRDIAEAIEERPEPPDAGA